MGRINRPIEQDVECWAALNGAVEIVARTDSALPEPNIVFQFAAEIVTPNGRCSGGFVHLQPDPDKPPLVSGFVAQKRDVFSYVTRNLNAGTTFESLPFIKVDAFGFVTKEFQSILQFEFRALGIKLFGTLGRFGNLKVITRRPQSRPFHFEGLEREAKTVEIHLANRAIQLHLPKSNGNGGPAASHLVSGVIWR